MARATAQVEAVACDPARDFPVMIEHARAGRIDLDAMVTEVFPLSRWQDAIAATRSGAVVRSVLDLTA